MKNLFLILSICISVAVKGQLNKGNVEFAYSYGALAGKELSILRQPGTTRGATTVLHSGGANSVMARYYVTDRFSVGISYAYHYFNGRISEQYSRLYYSSKQHIFTADFKLLYINRETVKTYGSISAGITAVKSTTYLVAKSGNFFCMHFVFWGISIGKDLRGFAELGLGCRGLVNGGISYRLKPDRTTNAAATGDTL